MKLKHVLLSVFPFSLLKDFFPTGTGPRMKKGPFHFFDDESEQTESMIPKNLKPKKLFRAHRAYQKSFLKFGE